MPQRFQRPAKPNPYNFRLEIDGVVCARFQDASGLDAPHGTPRTTITLKRGATTGPALWTWRSQGNVPSKNGSLILLDASGAERGRWRFEGARVSKWAGPGFNAKGRDVAMDLIELTCERIEEE